MTEFLLGEICEFINGGAWSDKEYVDTGIPVLKVSNCKPSGFVIDEINYLPFESEEKYQRNKLKVGDVIIATVGSHPNLVDSAAGRTCIVTHLVEGFFLNQNAVCVRTGNPDILDQSYLGYFSKTQEFQHYIQMKGRGAANQMRIAIGSIKEFRIKLPPIEVQKKIAVFLSRYDELLENNQKQIKLLEEAAQRLYKEWFVDLHFPGYENTPVVDGVPEGWEKNLLADIIGYEIGGGWGEDEITEKCDIPAYVIRGTDLYGITHGDITEIPYRFHPSKNYDARKLFDRDIIFEVSGGSKTEGVARTMLIRSPLLAQWENKAMCASFCKLIRVKDLSHAQLLYDTFQYMRSSGKTTEYDKRSASSIVNYRWKDFLSMEAVLIPPKTILSRYNAIAENIYQMIVQKSITIEKAKSARDRLLPRLMSGEIEVK